MSFEGTDLVKTETDVYYIKYLKYKQKYLDLKEQLGGIDSRIETRNSFNYGPVNKLMQENKLYVNDVSNPIIHKLPKYKLLKITKVSVEEHYSTIDGKLKAAYYKVKGEYLDITDFFRNNVTFTHGDNFSFSYNYNYNSWNPIGNKEPISGLKNTSLNKLIDIGIIDIGNVLKYNLDELKKYFLWEYNHVKYLEKLNNKIIHPNNSKGLSESGK